jgi:hypothetical protein
MNVAPPVVLLVTRETLRWNAAEAVTRASLVTVRAIDQGVHAGERKARATVDRKGVGALKRRCVVAAIAALTELACVSILVAVAAGARDASAAIVTVRAGRAGVASAQRKSRAVMVESVLRAKLWPNLPAFGSVAYAALHPFGRPPVTIAADLRSRQIERGEHAAKGAEHGARNLYHQAIHGLSAGMECGSA